MYLLKEYLFIFVTINEDILYCISWLINKMLFFNPITSNLPLHHRMTQFRETTQIKKKYISFAKVAKNTI
jgi:hypothetical protein